MKPPTARLVQNDGIGLWLKDGDSDRYVCRVLVGDSIVRIYWSPLDPKPRSIGVDLSPDAPHPPGVFSPP